MGSTSWQERGAAAPIPHPAFIFGSFILLCCFLGFCRFELASPGLRETDENGVLKDEKIKDELVQKDGCE